MLHPSIVPISCLLHPAPPCAAHILPLCELYTIMLGHKGTCVRLLPRPLDYRYTLCSFWQVQVPYTKSRLSVSRSPLGRAKMFPLPPLISTPCIPGIAKCSSSFTFSLSASLSLTSILFFFFFLLILLPPSSSMDSMFSWFPLSRTCIPSFPSFLFPPNFSVGSISSSYASYIFPYFLGCAPTLFQHAVL